MTQFTVTDTKAVYEPSTVVVEADDEVHARRLACQMFWQCRWFDVDAKVAQETADSLTVVAC